MALTIDRNAGKSNSLSSHRKPARLHDFDCQHRAQLLTMAAVKFSIITPSFRNSHWLKLCIASVADQQGVELEHIVQDSCSDDGTQDWLPHDRRVQAFIEKDGGMYDAVNRGYRRATRRHPRISQLRRTISARRAQGRS